MKKDYPPKGTYYLYPCYDGKGNLLSFSSDYEADGAYGNRQEIYVGPIWKPADGDDLPEIDKEVIALVWENGHYKAVFAHRPQEYWDGRNIVTGKVTRYYPKRYDKGGWNMPDVKWWLDIDLPKMEE